MSAQARDDEGSPVRVFSAHVAVKRVSADVDTRRTTREATMRTSVTRRLGVATALAICLATAACSSGATEASPEDRARSSCSKYLQAYDARDQTQMDAVVAEVITLANEQQDPETAQPGLASLVATTVLSAGPLPWQPQQYGLLRQACVALIAR